MSATPNAVEPVPAVPKLLPPQQLREQLLTHVTDCRARNAPLSFVLYQLHPEGQRDLKAEAMTRVAGIIREHTPQALLGDFGEWRLGHVVPSTHGDDAMSLARAVCDHVDAACDDLSISAGVAAVPAHAQSGDELWRRAGEALTRACCLGRGNCCDAQLRILMCGESDALAEARASLLARAEFHIIDTEPRHIMEALAKERPNLVVLGASMSRRYFKKLTAALQEPALAQTRIVVVTPKAHETRYASRVALMPSAHIVAGGPGLSRRLKDTVADVLGARVRRAQRHDLRMEVRIMLAAGGSLRGELRDISETGARIAVDVTSPMELGDSLVLDLDAPDGRLQLPSTVVRRLRPRENQLELGVSFDRIDKEAAQRLERLLSAADVSARGVIMATTRGEPNPNAAQPLAVDMEVVSRTFGTYEALSNVTFSVRPGERVAIIGRSGAGKSTMMRLLNSSMTPSSGRVRLLGENPAELSERKLRALRSRIGTVYQSLLLIPQASVFHNIVAGRLGRQSLLRSIADMVSRHAAEQIAAVVEQVGLLHKLYERVDRLSGGEQQRVAIARALYQDPEILLADEPLASLDPARSAEVVDLFLDAAKNRTLLLSTHQLEPVLPYVSRVIALRGGRLFFDKPRSEVSIDDISRVYESERTNRTGGQRSAYAPASKTVRGELVVASCRTAGEYILPEVTAAFCREHPGRKIQVMVCESQSVITEIIEGRAHIGFIGAHIADAQVHTEVFTEDEIIAVASPRFTGLPTEPLAPSLVARLPRIDQPLGAATRQIVEDYFANIGAPLDPNACAYEGSTFTATKSAVGLGVGIAFISRMAVQPELDSGVLRALKIDAVKMTRRIFVCWRGDEPLALTAKTYRDLARRMWSEKRGRGPTA